VDFQAGFLKHLGIERATLVGNSLGGWVAASFALADPKRVERLVLVDAAGFASLAASLGKRGMSALRLGTREDLRYFALLTFYDQTVFANDSSLDAAFSHRLAHGDGYTIGRLAEAIARGDDALDGRLSAIKQPTLIVWGRADRMVPLSFGERFKKEIGGSQLVIIEKCGHMPQIECPTDLTAALLRFLPHSN
jgi:pimeloyl-ACP methyl ester carboxylesterase